MPQKRRLQTKNVLPDTFTGNGFVQFYDSFSERLMLQKTYSAGSQTPLAIMIMPQFNFHQALSNPVEKLVSPTVAATETGPARSTEKLTALLANAFDFSHSTWTNIVFVAIASLGGLFCAFYFFNGTEVVRLAAAWPGELLYPRPDSTYGLDASQPNAVDRFGGTSSDSRNKRNVSPFDRRFFPRDLAEPGAPSGGINPGGLSASDPTTTPFANAGSAIGGGLNSLPRGADTISQSFYRTAVSMNSKTVERLTSHTVISARRRVSSVQQNVAGKPGNVFKTASSRANSTNATRPAMQTYRQTASQVRADLSTVHAQSQMMMGGGRGGLGGSIGAGVGSAGLRGGTGMGGRGNGGRH